jgi:ketosteroid isomerase-like protein
VARETSSGNGHTSSYPVASKAALRRGILRWAMSEENVKATKRATAALNRGDFDGVEEFYAADAVLQDLQNAPDQPLTVEGVQAIRQNLNLWAAAFDELRVDIEEYIDGPNAVICAAHWQGQGKASGISIDVHQFDLYEFREGKVVRAILGFRSKNEALNAAELLE